jgi:signal transduction histidine kinase
MIATRGQRLFKVRYQTEVREIRFDVSSPQSPAASMKIKERRLRSASPHSSDEHRFAAALAHDISNPLDVVMNLLHLLQGEVTLSEKGRRYLKQVQEEVRRIAQITRGTLEEFHHGGALECTDIPKLMQSVLDSYRSRFQAAGILIQTRFGACGNLPAYPHQLQQLFANLLGNSLDAMPRGGRLQIRCARVTEGGGERRRGLRLTLADNGVGVAPDVLHRMFEPFFSTKGRAGHGIGLSLVKYAVHKHKGVLRVRSSTKPGHSGTVFTIFLPIKPGASDSRGQISRAA